MIPENDFISVPKAAEKVGVDRRTMWRWVKSGKIRSFVTPGGHHRIQRTDIDALLERNGFSGMPEPAAKTILIVDDDSLIRKTFEKRLTRKNYTVETASDGFTAGIKSRDVKPDLIVLDLMMEGIDGFEVCRTIRADRSLKNTKILIITGFDSPENRKRALQEGADDFLPKSGSFETILDRISALLASS